MDRLDSGLLEELLAALGDHLASSEESAAIVVVGGSTLAARGWVSRTTNDVDVIAQAAYEGGRWTLVEPDPLPPPLVDAATRVARDFGLAGDWLNTVIGAQWHRGLPEGFAEEVEWRRYGALDVGFAGRKGLIALKLFAAVDSGPKSVHTQDLVALRPSAVELSSAADWVVTQDASEHFSTLVGEAVEHVRRALAGGGSAG